jgi:hypothetical protein
MSLMTVFSAPKPFIDPHINTIQLNALASWCTLPDVNVLLIGDEAGIAEVARDFGVTHLKDVRTNEKGTPLVSSIFQLAREHSDSSLLCYVNADIILLPEIVGYARGALEQLDEFLLIGQRWDMEMTEQLQFNNAWDARLLTRTRSEARLHPPAGSDYFIFPRELYRDIPDFAIGRAGWDNWMIYHAVTQPWPAVDATRSITIIHQNHDYRHMDGAQPHYKQAETFENVVLGGGMRNMYMLLDAEREMVNGRIRPASPRPARWVRALERWLQPAGEVGVSLRWRITRALRRLRRWMLQEAG